MARKSRPTSTAATPPSPSKTAILVELLARPEGATLDDLASATGWQRHSIRGALAGALKRKGYRITSETSEDIRRYRIEEQE